MLGGYITHYWIEYASCVVCYFSNLVLKLQQNSMSIHLGLFYAFRLENCFHCPFVLTFLYVIVS